MLHANLSPVNPWTMQRHNCVQQALEASGFCTIPKKHAREGVRLCWEASGQEAAYQVLLNGPRTAQAVPVFHGHAFHQL